MRRPLEGGASALAGWPTAVMGMVLLAAAAAWPAFAAGGGGAEAAQVSYPLALFADGRARHFEYRTADGVLVRYFLLKSSDGVVRAAFDACDVCWPEGKGYVQKGDLMVCKNCGRGFASAKINVVSGGCNPAPLKRETAGDRVVIKTRDILEGRRYFAGVRR